MRLTSLPPNTFRFSTVHLLFFSTRCTKLSYVTSERVLEENILQQQPSLDEGGGGASGVDPVQPVPSVRHNRPRGSGGGDERSHSYSQRCGNNLILPPLRRLRRPTLLAA